MAAKVVELDQIGTVQLHKRKGSRNIRLSFARNGDIRVSLPFWVPYQTGLQFALQRQEWIIKHRPSKPFGLTHGDRIGKAHRLQFVSSNTAIKPSVRITNNLITVQLPLGMSENHTKAQVSAVRGAIRALKKESEQLLPQRLKVLAANHDFNYKSVTVKKLSSRWGSCSQHNEITLNLFLMQIPWNLIDYVLVHELVHTEHLNHSPEFWQRFASIIPNPKKLRKELKNYQTAVKATI
ncbi:M48 family metallopeptidase [Candidatus Saccharibacteria bacterium]|nr:M48 family metallopeptidase [Candidatus Saccharibacteria bacterium]